MNLPKSVRGIDPIPAWMTSISYWSIGSACICRHYTFFYSYKIRVVHQKTQACRWAKTAFVQRLFMFRKKNNKLRMQRHCTCHFFYLLQTFPCCLRRFQTYCSHASRERKWCKPELLRVKNNTSETFIRKNNNNNQCHRTLLLFLHSRDI